MEIHDQLWCPVWIRNYLTSFLHLSHRVAKLNEFFLPVIEKALEEADTKQIVDLGSGSGGPFLDLESQINKSLSNKIKIVLTDLNPSEDAANKIANKIAKLEKPNLFYLMRSIDATKVPQSLVGLRTMITSFHHMTKQNALKILSNSQSNKQAILILEPFSRNLKTFLALLPIFLTPFLFAPFIKPFDWKNIFFTYFIPVLPIVIIFDGWVSYLRIYSKPDLKELVSQLPSSKHYSWTIFSISPLDLPVLKGIPIYEK